MEKRCFACMSPIDGNICRRCGHDNAGPGNGKEGLLKPGTVVGGRYMAGIPLDKNGEGVTYIAFDQNIQTRVRLREFYPGALCRREGDRRTVAVNPGCEIRYKALMTDFAELSKQLIGITANNSLLKARDMLSDNGTIYVAYEDVNGVTLTKYLMDNAGSLSWEETENLFLPLLYTVKLLNSNGIIHRGISPDTIVVTENHELKLKGVCTSAVRAINTEIRPELFAGYAAPEQYEKCTSHGEWTDVYAVCAVLYKTLTGAAPQRADIRLRSGDTLIPPAELDPSIPRNVSDAIMQGLVCRRDGRTAYIKNLIGGLYAASPREQPAHRIIEEDEDMDSRTPRRNGSGDRSPDRRTVERSSYESAPRGGASRGRSASSRSSSRAGGSSKKRKKRFRMPVWLIVILVTLPIMLLIFWGFASVMLGTTRIFGYTLGKIFGDDPVSSQTVSMPSSQPTIGEPESSAPASQPDVSSHPEMSKVVVPQLIGQNYDDVIASEAITSMVTFEEKAEKYDENAPIGEIIGQSVDSGTLVPQGTKISLIVSKGRQFVTLPPLTDASGLPVALDDYIQYLTEQGLNVKVEEKDDPSYAKGEIISMSQEPGTAVDREQVTDFMIYISTGESYAVLHGGEGNGEEAFDSLD